mgnify:CR=1 FL=1
MDNISENLIDDDLYNLIDSLENSNVNKDKNENECKNCKTDNIDIVNGIILCTNCGCIISEKIDKNIYNNSNNNKNISNYGCPTNPFLPKASLGTKIKGYGRSKIKLMERWSQMPYKERSLLNVLKFIENKCFKHNIPISIVENAKILFKRINDSKYTSGKNKGKNIIIRGQNRISLIAACVFNGAIKQKMPRSPKEIAEIFDIAEKNVSKGCRKLRELIPNDNILINIKSIQPQEFLSRETYIKKLKLTSNHVKMAKKMLINIHKIHIVTDHQPHSITAGCLLLLSELLSELKISKKLISDTFKISQVTIIKTYKKILKYTKIIISNKKTEKFIELLNKKNNNDYEIDSLDSLISIDSINSYD